MLVRIFKTQPYICPLSTGAAGPPAPLCHRPRAAGSVVAPAPVPARQGRPLCQDTTLLCGAGTGGHPQQQEPQGPAHPLLPEPLQEKDSPRHRRAWRLDPRKAGASPAELHSRLAPGGGVRKRSKTGQSIALLRTHGAAKWPGLRCL